MSPPNPANRRSIVHIEGPLKVHHRQQLDALAVTMFHRSEKAVRYAKELDEARLNGYFHLVPNLARKLQKHDPQKQCITHMTTANMVGVAKSAVCEKSLVDITAPLEKGQLREISSIDGPRELVLPPTVRPEQMQEIVRSVDEAINAPGTADEIEVYYSSLMH
jgi:hypothetical protein